MPPEYPHEFPPDRFEREYPIHTARASQSVARWYYVGVNQLIVNPDLLRRTTATFFNVATQHPEDVYIHDTPLSFALEGKRISMLEQFKHIAPADYVRTFAHWFNSNLTNDTTPEKKTAIERMQHVIYCNG